jgi:hypothetical protein
MSQVAKPRLFLSTGPATLTSLPMLNSQPGSSRVTNAMSPTLHLSFIDFSLAPLVLASPELAGAQSEGDALAIICESPLQVVLNRRRVLPAHKVNVGAMQAHGMSLQAHLVTSCENARDRAIRFA